MRSSVLHVGEVKEAVRGQPHLLEAEHAHGLGDVGVLWTPKIGQGYKL
jgi:hypothetical protein